MKKEKTERGSVIPAVILTIAMCALIVAGIAVTAKAVKAYDSTHNTELKEGGDR